MTIRADCKLFSNNTPSTFYKKQYDGFKELPWYGVPRGASPVMQTCIAPKEKEEHRQSWHMATVRPVTCLEDSSGDSIQVPLEYILNVLPLRYVYSLSFEIPSLRLILSNLETKSFE